MHLLTPFANGSYLSRIRDILLAKTRNLATHWIEADGREYFHLPPSKIGLSPQSLRFQLVSSTSSISDLFVATPYRQFGMLVHGPNHHAFAFGRRAGVLASDGQSVTSLLDGTLASRLVQHGGWQAGWRIEEIVVRIGQTAGAFLVPIGESAHVLMETVQALGQVEICQDPELSHLLQRGGIAAEKCPLIESDGSTVLLSLVSRLSADLDREIVLLKKLT